MSETELDINIKKLDGTSFPVKVTHKTTVPALKQKILEVSGVPLPLQRIIYKGKVLRDDQTLGFYNIEDGNTLHLAERAPESTTPQHPTPSTTAGHSEQHQQQTNNPRVVRMGGNQIGGNDLQNLLRSITGGNIPTQTSIATASVNMGQQIRQSFQHLNDPNNNNNPQNQQQQQQTNPNQDPIFQNPPHTRLIDYLELSTREIQVLLDRTNEFTNQARNSPNITNPEERQQLQDTVTSLATRFGRLSQASNLLSQGLSAFRFGNTPQEANFVPTTVSGVSQISLQIVADANGNPVPNINSTTFSLPPQPMPQGAANIFSNLGNILGGANGGNINISGGGVGGGANGGNNDLNNLISGILGSLTGQQPQQQQQQQSSQQPQQQQPSQQQRPQTPQQRTSTTNSTNNNNNGLPDLFSMLPQISSMFAGLGGNSGEDSPFGNLLSSLPTLLGDVRLAFSEDPQQRLQGHNGFRNVFIEECLENNTSQDNIDLFVNTFINVDIRPYVTLTNLPADVVSRVIPNTNLNEITCRVLEQHLRSLISIILTQPSTNFNISTHIREWFSNFFTDLVDSIAACFTGGVNDASQVIQNFISQRLSAINPLFGSFSSIVSNSIMNAYHRSHQPTSSSTTSPVTPSTTTTTTTRPTTSTSTTTTTSSNNNNNNTANSIIPQEWKETIEIDEARQESSPPSKPLSSLYLKGEKKSKSNTTTTTTSFSTPTTPSNFQQILDQALQNSNMNTEDEPKRKRYREDPNNNI